MQVPEPVLLRGAPSCLRRWRSVFVDRQRKVSENEEDPALVHVVSTKDRFDLPRKYRAERTLKISVFDNHDTGRGTPAHHTAGQLDGRRGYRDFGGCPRGV